MSDDTLLTLLWFVPAAGAGIVLLIPKGARGLVRWFSLGVTLVTLILSIIAYRSYTEETSPARATLQERAQNNVLEAEEGTKILTRSSEQAYNPNGDPRPSGAGDLMVRKAWIPAFDIQYYLGLDGISLSLVLLTAFVAVLACGASWNIEKEIKGYFSLFLLLLACMMGVFIALDLILFYVFFEVMLLPMYFLIAVWGGENREYAAIKFLLYTLFGSVFILVAILALYFWGGVPEDLHGKVFNAHTFDAVYLADAVAHTRFYSPMIQGWIFWLFFTGFCVKLPSVPFHTWLPDAHVQAPTPISMILAGVLLKIGGYGLVRLAWPLAPIGAFEWSYAVAAIGVISIIYGALAAMAQTDFKKLVAYSSVSHMGYCTLGMAAMNLGDGRYYAYGVDGAMFMMIAHGITSTGMFFLVGVIYDRAHTRDLNKLGGLINFMPLYGAVSFLIFFGSMGLPGLCGFVAEVFVVLAAFNYNWPLSVIAAAAVILTAGYILWTIQRVFLGKKEDWKSLPDMNLREVAISVPLVFFTVLLGVLPSSLLSWMSPSVEQVVANVRNANRAAGSSMQTASVPPPVVRGIR
jgi:NADH-quinone oxidoreductase subunit M